jgi:hypothetical protein
MEISAGWAKSYFVLVYCVLSLKSYRAKYGRLLIRPPDGKWDLTLGI